tara:strand:- start:7804 stop:8172 length:369 start_codon:yes stop_codon:yes gene_type:complete
MGMEGMSQHSENTMMKTEASCSRCGGADASDPGKGLSLVTIPYDGGQGAGRILVYCRSCWTDMAEHVAEVIPLEMVSPGVLLDLYRTGKTTSDPFTACELLFGRAEPELVREAQVLISQSGR